MAFKGGKTSVPSPKGASQGGFVLGSRPAVLRSPSLPRISPQAGQRNYGKQAAPAATAAPFSTLGSGDTGMGGMS